MFHQFQLFEEFSDVIVSLVEFESSGEEMSQFKYLFAKSFTSFTWFVPIHNISSNSTVSEKSSFSEFGSKYAKALFHAFA